MSQRAALLVFAAWLGLLRLCRRPHVDRFHGRLRCDSRSDRLQRRHGRA